MKTSSLMIALTIIPLFAFANDSSSEIPPVYYWQLMHEERYIRIGTDMENRNWREIRELRQSYKNAFQEIKSLELKRLAAPDNDEVQRSSGRDFLNPAVVMVRDPNGDIAVLPDIATEVNCVKIPEDENLNGRYLLGLHIPLGKRDVDGDGIDEFVHICAKHLVVHRKNGGKLGGKSVVFFDDAGQMPFEIGPAMNTAKSKFGGGSQQPHRSYEIQLKYLNKPLAGAEVTVINMASQWKKCFVTNDEGKFEIIPPDHRSGENDWQKYLYVAAHHDRETNSYYVATLPIVVFKNQPEWLSKTMGFTYWAIISSFVLMLMALGFIFRERRRENQALAVFEKYKMQKDRP